MKNSIAFFVFVFLLSSCSSLHIEQRKYRKGWYVSNNNRHTVRDSAQSTTVNTDLNSSNKPKKTDALAEMPTPSENVFHENTDSATTDELNSSLLKPVNAANTIAEAENNVRNITEIKKIPVQEKKHSSASTPLPVRRLAHIPTLDETRNIAASIHPAVKIVVGLVLMTVVTFFLLLATPFLWFFSFLLGLALLIAGIIDLVQRSRGNHTPEKAARNLRGSLVAMIALGAVMVAVFLVLLVLMPFIILSEFV
jgi:hypothetical protein